MLLGDNPTGYYTYVEVTLKLYVMQQTLGKY